MHVRLMLRAALVGVSIAPCILLLPLRCTYALDVLTVGPVRNSSCVAGKVRATLQEEMIFLIWPIITHAATCAHGGPMHDDGMRSDI